MNFLTLKSNGTIWHVNMDLIETVRVTLDETGRADGVDFYFKGDGSEPSLEFTPDEDDVDAIAKTLDEYLSRQRRVSERKD